MGLVDNRDVFYAMSMAFSPDYPELISAASTPPFTGLELPAGLLEKTSLHSLGLDSARVTACDLMDRALTYSVADQNPRIVAEFQSQFQNICRRLGDNHVESATMDIGLDSGGGVQEGLSSRQELVKRLYPILHSVRLRLLTPVRVPLVDAEYPQHLASFLQGAACPYLGVVVNIHPHELGGDFSPRDLLRWVRFDVDMVRFVYEPDTGNHLVPRIVKPWLEHLRTSGFSGMVAFAPRTVSSEVFLDEIRRVGSLLESCG